MGAASFICSTAVPFIMTSSSNSNFQPSLSILKLSTCIPKFSAAICVLIRVRKLGFKNNKPILLLTPKCLSKRGFSLYSNAFFTKASISFTSFTEIKFCIDIYYFKMVANDVKNKSASFFVIFKAGKSLIVFGFASPVKML